MGKSRFNPRSQGYLCTQLPRTAELFAKWSGKRDSNPRPRAWKARALPTELFPLSCGLAKFGGEGRIRTSVGISRQIYSLLPLAAREPLRIILPAIGPSRWRESNSQPTAYKAVALPLSYIGAGDKPLYLFCPNSQVKTLTRISSKEEPETRAHHRHRQLTGSAAVLSQITQPPPPPTH
jgi:hypothetical protein